MTLATPRDKALVIAIFQQAFKNNPHIKFLMGTKNLDHKIAIMTSYVFDIAVARQGVYLSKDRMGALIAFDFDQLPLIRVKSSRKSEWHCVAFHGGAWARYRELKV